MDENKMQLFFSLLTLLSSIVHAQTDEEALSHHPNQTTKSIVEDQTNQTTNSIVEDNTAIAEISPDINNPLGRNVFGFVVFTQLSESSNISVKVRIMGLVPGSIHGWHVHGNLVNNQNCTAVGPHWNPKNATHGARRNRDTKRHYGDLGNFKANRNGRISATFTDHLISFFGEFPMKNNSLSLVIHENPDDLGLGSNNDTLKTGNVGSRLACGNIVLI